MVTDLWTPQGVVKLNTTPSGYNAVTGGSVVAHTFRLEDKDTGRKTIIKVLADKDTDPAHIEDMAAQSAEEWFNKVRAEGSKKVPTVSQRKEIGKILDDIRKNFKKRRQSSNNKILYNGLK
jgi:hypothetical protein|tara:strand:- start:179 stop:541 length:363 start_codon:yes stop_codon:yes gene_type:complete